MWNNWIGQRIRRSNRWLFLFGLFLCGVAVALLWLLRFGLDNFFRGPFPITQTALSAIRDPNQVRQYFVTFDAPVRMPTNFRVVSGETRTPHAEYVLVILQEREFLMRAPIQHEGDVFTGEIRSPDVEEQSRIFAVLDRSRLLPFVVDAQTNHFRGNVLSVLCLVLLLAGLGTWLLCRAGRRMRNLERHPLAQSLRRFGTPHEVADTITAETAGTAAFRLGGIRFLGRWLDCGSNLVRVDDLVWVYKLVVRVNGVPGYHVKMHDRHGFQMNRAMKEDHVNAVLTALLSLAPWLVAGYEMQLEQIWNQERAALIAAVDQRRLEHQQSLQPKTDNTANGAAPSPS